VLSSLLHPIKTEATTQTVASRKQGKNKGVPVKGMKTYAGLVLWLCSLLTSTLDGGE